MKLKKQGFNPYGLRARFALSLGISALICGLLFCVLYHTMDHLLTNYFEQSRFIESHIRKQGHSLQDYIDQNDISSAELQKLNKWERKQPVILLELYSDRSCIYNSFYDIPENRFPYDTETDNRNNVVTVQLTDMAATAVLYSDFSYQYYVLGTASSVIISLVLFVLLFLRSNQKIIQYICRLNEEVQILEGGNLEYQVSVEGNDEITDLAKSMNRMRKSFQQQMETEQKLHNANRKLITELSHDLRTPLTGIMLYLEILRSHRYSTDSELHDYLEKIDSKAHHMKLLSDHLFEYSLEDAPEKRAEAMSMEQAFSAVVVSFKDDLKARGFHVVSELAWTPCFVQVNREYLQRIFENITSNLTKYADPSVEIRLETIDSDHSCGFSVLNACAPTSFHTESTGIGIKSIRSMIKKMNGDCTVEQTDSFFEITLLFPKQ